MDLSIIIVSFNTKEVTRDCLRSIYNAKWKSSFEVIVVDNNSHDGSVEMIREEFPQVKVIANPDNRLFAIANNQGAAIAEGRWLLLLNSDTLVSADNLQRLIDYADTLPEDVVCVGPKLLNPDGSLQSEGCFGSSHYDMFVKHFKIGSLLPSFIGKHILPPGTYRWNRNFPHQVGWVVGAAMLMRAKTYNEIGGLNEELEFYGEEPEFCYRSGKLGYKTIYHPCVEITHLGGVSSKTAKKKPREAEREIALRRYGIIVRLTVGYDYAIGTSRITRAAYWMKYLMTLNPAIKQLINNETECIAYLKQLKKKEKKKE